MCNEYYFFFAEVFEGDASHTRRFHRWISFEHNSWFQRSLGHYYEVNCVTCYSLNVLHSMTVILQNIGLEKVIIKRSECGFPLTLITDTSSNLGSC